MENLVSHGVVINKTIGTLIMQRRCSQSSRGFRWKIWLAQKIAFSAFMVISIFVFAGCNSGNSTEPTAIVPAAEDTVEAPQEADTSTPQPPAANTPTPETVATEVPTQALTVDTSTNTPEPPPSNTPTLEPLATDTASPPTDTPTVVETPATLFYNLRSAILTSATGLYASPNRSEFIVPVTIPEGETIYVMGRNATSSHLRAVWNTGVGWIPVSFTNYIGQRDTLLDLPVFEQEPPACAVPLTTQFGFNSEWTSDKRQRIAVVADLFRSKYGPFPNSSLSLKINNFEIESSRRPIVENGQFSLKDVVFSPGQDIQEGETVGYILNTSSDEPLTFMATIFSIPQNCQWEID